MECRPRFHGANRAGEKMEDNRKYLAENEHLTHILIVHENAEDTKSEGVWDVLDSFSGTIEGPEDWSLEHDHYLYGSPRKKDAERT
jgi:hypothetical protein